jgi:hypothetical protein
MSKKACSFWVARVIFIVLGFMPALVFAQQGAAVLTGTVVDAASKKPIADVVVTVTSPNLQGEQMVVTDSAGLYRVPGLPPGTYVVRLEKESFRPFEREGIGLRADTTIRVNAELLPESLKAEEVTVVARPPTVDVGSSTAAMNISSDFTRRIPLSRPGAKGSGTRSFESVAEAAPGARDDNYGVSIAGTTSPENQYVLDGVSVNNPAFGVVGTPLSMEFIKEVNVISGGYMPEYGRATGGVLNVVTKSGSNEFHGSVFGYYTPGTLEGKRQTVVREGQNGRAEQELAFIGDVGAEVGGPIVKDKLWFFAGVDFARTRYNLSRSIYATQFDASNRPLRTPTGFTQTELVPGSERYWIAQSQTVQAIGKLTYALNQDNQLALSVFASPTTSGGSGQFSISSASGQPEVTPRTNILGSVETLGHRRISNPLDVTVKWTSAFANKRVMLDTTAGWHNENASILASDGSGPGIGAGLASQPRLQWRRTVPHSITDFEAVPGGGCDPIASPMGGAAAIPCPVSSYFTGGPLGMTQQKMNRYQARSILTVLIQGAGHHVIKAGVDAEMTNYDSYRSFSGGLSYRERTNGLGFDEVSHYGFLQNGDPALGGPNQFFHLDALHAKTRSIIAGGFVQDSWSIMDKVTLNAGVRYDTQFMYNSHGERSLSLPHQWSPRVGLIYDPTQSGRAKIVANYARFYESVPLDIADRSLSGEAAVQSRFPAGRPGVPCPATAQEGTAGKELGPCLGENMRQAFKPSPDPNRKYITVGAGPQAIDPDIKPQSTDEIVGGAEYEIIRDGRLGFSYTKRWMNYVIEDMSRDEAATYFLGNPGFGIAKDFPRPTRDYDAGTLYLTKIFADNWLAQASYTVSYLRGNYAGLFRPENNQLDPNINSDFDLRSLLLNRTGPLPGDRRHQVKLFAAKDWVLTANHHVTTGASARARSGDPTSHLGGHVVYGVDQAYILPRGSGERLPWEFSADLQLGYRFSIDKDKTIHATIDIFNVFNFQAAIARDERYTASAVLPVTTGDLNSVKHPDGTPFIATTADCPPAPAACVPEKNPNFGNPILYQPPRIFRFGLRATF